MCNNCIARTKTAHRCDIAFAIECILGVTSNDRIESAVNYVFMR